MHLNDLDTRRVHYLCNLNTRTKYDGYKHGDLVMEAGVQDFGVDDDLGACESAFMFWNRDDRPNGQTAPSLSVGDVVMVRGGTLPGVRYYQCDRLGFTLMPDTPIEVIFDEQARTVADVMRDESAKHF